MIGSKHIFFVALGVLCFLDAALGVSDLPQQPPDSPSYQARIERSDQYPAGELFKLARRENPRLKWDNCLARQAFSRAKVLVEEGYFDHKSPDTGRNPVWKMMKRCRECRYAAENLVKGYADPETLHQALMKSTRHRANIVSTRHSLMGVGCYEDVCVELFMGF